MVTTVRTSRDRWLPHRPPPAPGPRLLCLPHAGGGASAFLPLQRALAGRVRVSPVELPGRETRAGEPFSTDIDALADDLADVVGPEPAALLGHSLGGLVAFELAHRLQSRGAPPVALFLSAAGDPAAHAREAPIHTLPEPAFVDALRAWGGLPDEVAHHRELRTFFLSILAADFRLYFSFAERQRPRLQTHLVTFAGERDACTPPAAMIGWRKQTAGRFTEIRLDADHFFHRTHAAVLAEHVAEVLRASAPAPTPSHPAGGAR